MTSFQSIFFPLYIISKYKTKNVNLMKTYYVDIKTSYVDMANMSVKKMSTTDGVCRQDMRKTNEMPSFSTDRIACHDANEVH